MFHVDLWMWCHKPTLSFSAFYLTELAFWSPFPSQQAGIICCRQETFLHSHCMVSCHCALAGVVERGEGSGRMTAEWGEEGLRGQGTPGLHVPAGSQRCQTKVGKMETDTAVKRIDSQVSLLLNHWALSNISRWLPGWGHGTSLHLLIEAGTWLQGSATQVHPCWPWDSPQELLWEI